MKAECKRCSFFSANNDGHATAHSCSHPDSKPGQMIDTYWSNMSGWNVRNDSPEWCPLTEEEIRKYASKAT